MRGVDLYGRSPLSSGQELAAQRLFSRRPLRRSRPKGKARSGSGVRGRKVPQPPRSLGGVDPSCGWRERGEPVQRRFPSTRPAGARLGNPRLSPFDLFVKKICTHLYRFDFAHLPPLRRNDNKNLVA